MRQLRGRVLGDNSRFNAADWVQPRTAVSVGNRLRVRGSSQEEGNAVAAAQELAPIRLVRSMNSRQQRARSLVEQLLAEGPVEGPVEGPSQALADFLAKNKIFNQEDVDRALEEAGRALRSKLGHVGINGGSYAYYPVNQELTRWRASDGSTFRASLLEILLEYADQFVFEAVLDGQLEDFLIKKKVNQQDLEGGHY